MHRHLLIELWLWLIRCLSTERAQLEKLSGRKVRVVRWPSKMFRLTSFYADRRGRALVHDGRRDLDGFSKMISFDGALVLVVRGRTWLVLAVKRAHLGKRVKRTTLVLWLPASGYRRLLSLILKHHGVSLYSYPWVWSYVFLTLSTTFLCAAKHLYILSWLPTRLGQRKRAAHVLLYNALHFINRICHWGWSQRVQLLGLSYWLLLQLSQLVSDLCLQFRVVFSWLLTATLRRLVLVLERFDQSLVIWTF